MEWTRRSVIAGAGAAMLVPWRAQATATLLPPEALRADLALLRDAWITIHPGLHRYLTPAAFQRMFARADRWAAKPRTLAETYLQLAHMAAQIRCGHSYPNPLNQSEAVDSALFAGRDRLPFTFDWIEGRMIATGGALEPGTEVAAVDGVASRRLLAAMLPLARADGGNDAKRVAQMALRKGERYQAFDVYRPLLFPPQRPGETEITLAGGARRRLAALTESEKQAAGGRPDDAGWRFAMRGRTGIFTLPDWALYDRKWDWRGFLDTAVDRMIAEGAAGMVVDLRGNEGGLDCGDVLLERMVTAPAAKPLRHKRVRYRKVPDRLAPYCDTWDRSFQDWGQAAVGPDAAGFYALPADADDILRPRGTRFAGHMAVLIDATNSSATFQFAGLAKMMVDAILVGAPTGGNLRGINGSGYFFFRLPRTGLEMDIPLVGMFPEGPLPPDRGIEPDIRVVPSVADIAAKHDPVMTAALRALG